MNNDYLLFDKIAGLSLTPNSVALNCPSTGFTIDNVPPCNPLCTPEHSVHIKTPKVVEIHLGATI